MMMIPGTYYLGGTIRLAADVIDRDGNGVTPSEVKVRIVSPTGAVAEYTYNTDLNVDLEAVGAYRCDINPNRPGRWYARWTATDADVVAVSESYWHVQASPIMERMGLPALEIVPVIEGFSFEIDHRFPDASMYYPVAGV